ncbi:hypothetical protein EZS27_033558 [termite gut metagenome]
MLTDRLYMAPALHPPMPWLDNVPPTLPTQLTVTHTPACIRLNWNAATDNDMRNAPSYVIYASETYPVDTSRSEHIVAQRVPETNYVYIPADAQNHKMYFAVTATDRYGNESGAVQQQMAN